MQNLLEMDKYRSYVISLKLLQRGQSAQNSIKIWSTVLFLYNLKIIIIKKKVINSLFSRIAQPIHSTIFGAHFEISNTEHMKQGQRKRKAAAVKSTTSIQIITTVNKFPILAIYCIYYIQIYT